MTVGIRDCHSPPDPAIFPGMRAIRIVARGFRNLADLDLSLPGPGAVFLGPNGHGKTNLLEALYYPVLYRSFRGAPDTDLVRWNGDSGAGDGFHLSLTVGNEERPVAEREAGGRGETVFTAAFQRAARRKRIARDGVPFERQRDAIGEWLAVAFLPADLGLVQGAAAGRRQYLDRVLALADPSYLRTLARYRMALAQRNAALRAGQREVACAFDGALADNGAPLVARRLAWIESIRIRFAEECGTLGEPMSVAMEYRGTDQLAHREAWPAALARSLPRDLARRATMTGPHRDDLLLLLGDRRSFRDFGSRGQHRSAAIALKLCELETLAHDRQQAPALLLDDIFAELDGERQRRLAARLEQRTDGRQIFITAPRADELPPGLNLPVMRVEDGRVFPAAGPP